jgi:DNA primase
MAAGEKNEVIACEGYMDAIALHKFGFKNALAPLGTAITETQIELLWKLADEPILCFDSDEAGRRAGIRAALRSLPILKPGKSLKFCLIEGAKDPDEYLHSFGRDKFADMLAGAVSLSDILWRYFTDGRQILTPEARAGLQQDIAREFSRMKSEAVRKFYMDDFAIRMKREFAKIPAARKSAAPKASPENPNEKMFLACALFKPSALSRMLEEGRRAELSHPLYKKIFADVVAEVSLNPHTRETLLKALNDRGYRPENLLKFELGALAAAPDKVDVIMEEKLLSLRRGGLQDELKVLNREILSAPKERQEELRGKIKGVNAEISALDERLEHIGGIA